MQTRQSGADASIRAKRLARLVARAVGATMPSVKGKLQNSNLCIYKRQPAGIKTAMFRKGVRFHVYLSLLKKTVHTIFAHEMKKNVFQIYLMKSSAVRKVGMRALHRRHQKVAIQITLDQVAHSGTRVCEKRIKIR